MFISDLTTADAIPTLTTSLRFAGQRHRMISNNIANISTPNFQPRDVSVSKFQETLADAVDRRRREHDGVRGELKWRETRELQRDDRGQLELNPQPAGRNVLFHDRNNRDLERLMQDLTENTGAFRVTVELLRTRFDILESAIREEV